MLELREFSGGLNLRDSPKELALNETPDALNWTLDVRGQARLREGWTSVATLPGKNDGQTEGYIFYSTALDQWLCVRDSGAGVTHLFTRPGDFSGSWTDRGAMTSVDPRLMQAVDFAGATPKVVMVSHLSGVFTWDGTTLTAVTSTVLGSAIAVWQNRVWVAGQTSSSGTGNPTRLFASKIGDPATWAAPDGLTVDIRDKDAAALTALAVVGGSLIVFKQRSAYRVNDSATGAYTTIDSASGCMGAHAHAQLNGRLYTWGRDGIYEWDGVGPGRAVADKVRPLFFSSSVSLFANYTIRVGVVNRRLVFTYAAATDSGWSASLLEVDPSQGWAMKHQLSVAAGVSGFAVIGRASGPYARKGDTLYAPVLGPNAIYSVFTAAAGSDDSLITNRFRTKWLEPMEGRLVRIIRAQVEGLIAFSLTTSLTLNIYTGSDLSAPALTFDLSIDLRGGDSLDQVQTSILRSLGHSRAFAFEFVAGTAAGAAQVNSLMLDPVLLEG